jgi:hypothetical protein
MCGSNEKGGSGGAVIALTEMLSTSLDKTDIATSSTRANELISYLSASGMLPD